MFYHHIFLAISLLSPIFSIDLNTTLIDKYYENLCQVLVDSSNSIDNYFIESNGLKKSSKTEANLKTYFATENDQKSEYAMRLRLRVDLPNIRDKLRLIFEDEDSDDILNDFTELNDEMKVEKKYYFLRLDYFRYIKEKLNITSGVGVRFKMSSILYPYINVKSRYMIKRYEAVISNRFRVFSDRKVEDTLTLNRIKYLNENLYMLFRNYLKYRSNSDTTPIINSLSVTKLTSKKREVTVGISLASELIDLKSYVKYPQLYASYRDVFYKNWAYYELTPSILWRRENDYEPSYRIMFSFGMNFSQQL